VEDRHQLQDHRCAECVRSGWQAVYCPAIRLGVDAQRMQDKLDAIYDTKTDVPQGGVLLAQLPSASVAPTGREEIRIKQLLKCPRAHLRPINSATLLVDSRVVEFEDGVH
jgi:hypothetical protein